MKKLSLLSCMILFGGSQQFTSLHAGAITVTAGVTATKNNSQDGLMSVLNEEEGTRTQFFLRILQAEEMNDSDFADWYSGLNEAEQTMYKYYVKQGIIQEIQSIKQGASRVSLKRKIARIVSILFGGWIGCAQIDDIKGSLDELIAIAAFASLGYSIEEFLVWLWQNSSWLVRQESALAARFKKVLEDAEETFGSVKESIKNAKETWNDL